MIALLDFCSMTNITILSQLPLERLSAGWPSLRDVLLRKKTAVLLDFVQITPPPNLDNLYYFFPMYYILHILLYIQPKTVNIDIYLYI